jgi:hypothetical protein
MNLLVDIDAGELEKAIRSYATAFELKVERRFGSSGVERR